MVEQVFQKEFDMNIIRVNVRERFLTRLQGVEEPERKRKIIGEEFIRVFEEESKKLGKMDFLCQGTIYPDVVESGTGEAAVIKSHHNVGGLPEDIGFEGPGRAPAGPVQGRGPPGGPGAGHPGEPGVAPALPRPGPGGAHHGEVTGEKLALLQEADAIFREEVANAGLTRDVDQYFAVLTANRSVGVMGDGRTYGVTVALRAVTTTDFMTADWPTCPTTCWARPPTASSTRSPASTAWCTTSPANPRPPLSGNKTKRRKNPVFMQVCSVRRSLLITI